MDIYTDDAKAMVEKTTGALERIKTVVPSGFSRPSILYDHTLTEAEKPASLIQESP